MWPVFARAAKVGFVNREKQIMVIEKRPDPGFAYWLRNFAASIADCSGNSSIGICPALS
jgi:hypothetical protein